MMATVAGADYSSPHTRSRKRKLLDSLEHEVKVLQESKKENSPLSAASFYNTQTSSSSSSPGDNSKSRPKSPDLDSDDTDSRDSLDLESLGIKIKPDQKKTGSRPRRGAVKGHTEECESNDSLSVKTVPVLPTPQTNSRLNLKDCAEIVCIMDVNTTPMKKRRLDEDDLEMSSPVSGDSLEPQRSSTPVLPSSPLSDISESISNVSNARSARQGNKFFKSRDSDKQADRKLLTARYQLSYNKTPKRNSSLKKKIAKKSTAPSQKTQRTAIRKEKALPAVSTKAPLTVTSQILDDFSQLQNANSHTATSVREAQRVNTEEKDTGDQLFSQDLFSDGTQEDSGKQPTGDSGHGSQESPRTVDKMKNGYAVTPELFSDLASTGTVSSMSDVDSSETPLSRSPETPKQKTKLFPIFTGQANASVRSGPSSSPRMATTPTGLRKSSSPRTSPGHISRKLKKITDKENKEQLIIDAGQKQIGVSQCKTCGMFYTPADPTDKTAHSKFHDRHETALGFPGWKKERLVQGFYDGSRIISVVEEDPKYALRKLEDIQQIVDEELGFQENLYNILKRKTYLYISCDSKVIGVCVTEEISHGYRVLPDSQSSVEHSDRQRAWCCSTDKQPAYCGINRIWVCRGRRGQGIATKLVDCIRRTFTLGCGLSTDDIAFSDPTPDGKKFATKYTGTKQFLVYKYNM